MTHTPLTQNFEPAYMALYRSGELSRRVNRAITALENCTLCPRGCGKNRLQDEQGVCKTGRYARVASYFPHHGEEDCLRGWSGSGTIFFAECSLRCVFCQNADISHSKDSTSDETDPSEFAEIMLRLQAMGCHNINLVTPEHVVPQFLEALLIAVERGLRLPVVYNTSAYDSLENLALLDGVVNIYMPDFKFWDAEHARRYLRTPAYPKVACQAIKEMHRQVGDLQLDERGLAKRGLLVRHLVMPNSRAGTEGIVKFLAEEISPDTGINIMAQYHPAGRVSAEKYPEINRRLRASEFHAAQEIARKVGLHRFL